MSTFPESSGLASNVTCSLRHADEALVLFMHGQQSLRHYRLADAEKHLAEAASRLAQARAEFDAEQAVERALRTERAA